MMRVEIPSASGDTTARSRFHFLWKKLCPNLENTEPGFLKAFDDALKRIHKVADKVYVHGGKAKGTYAYTLAAGDF